YISFLFLFEFGVRIIASVIKKLQWLRYLPWILGGVWLINFVFFGFADVNIDYWLLTSEAWSRILICFPGALFASIGFLLQTEELNRLRVPQLKILLIGVSLSFLFYGLVAGLVVPNAPYFPFNWSAQFLSQYAPFAVPVVRSLAGGAMAYFSIRVMGIFYYEYRRLLEAAEKNETLSKERERISRDLHDGVIQSLYAIGLEVEEVSYLTSESPHQAQKSLENVINRLNGVILDIRFFIQDLLVKVMNRLQKEKDSPEEKLSEREKQILQLIGQGKTNKEIAETIFLSEKTVRNYVSSILHKLNLSHRSQAAVYAVRNQVDPRSFLGS
ncbi:helix-turn-helix transcriptional regulator, partial [Desulfosporosinus metallidurans]